MLILPVPVNLYKLFQYRCLTAIAALSKLGGVVVVAVDLSVMLVVTVLRSKNGRAS